MSITPLFWGHQIGSHWSRSQEEHPDLPINNRQARSIFTLWSIQGIIHPMATYLNGVLSTNPLNVLNKSIPQKVISKSVPKNNSLILLPENEVSKYNCRVCSSHRKPASSGYNYSTLTFNPPDSGWPSSWSSHCRLLRTCLSDPLFWPWFESLFSCWVKWTVKKQNICSCIKSSREICWLC